MKYLKVWTDFENVLSPLQDDEVGRLFIHMIRYARDGVEPAEFVGNEAFVWPAAKRDIDIAMERNEVCRANGLKGGRPKTKENQTEPNETKENQTEPNKSRQDKTRQDITRQDITGQQDIVILDTRKRFQPPTPEDVKAYCEERGSYWIDPQRFVDYYSLQGWTLKNGRKMVDWKAAVRLWEKNERDRQKKEQYEQYDLPY